MARVMSPWQTFEGLSIRGLEYVPKIRGPIFAADLDGTLIKTKSGSRFALDRNDWIWWDSIVPKFIRRGIQMGYTIVIFTNQGGVQKGKTVLSEIQAKIDLIVNSLRIAEHVVALISTSYDRYRKPSPEMWQCIFGSKEICPKSFFVGDAAGRVHDHSCSDRQFAYNVGIRFLTPEMLFLKQTEVEWSWKSPSPYDLIAQEAKREYIAPHVAPVGIQEMVILIGSPASGKTTLAKTIFSEYVHISNDVLKTKAKCLKACKQALATGKNVIIDNTNPKPEQRLPYELLAQEYRVTGRYIFVDVPKPLVMHLNRYRTRITGQKLIPDIAIHTFFKNVQIPSGTHVIPFRLLSQDPRIFQWS